MVWACGPCGQKSVDGGSKWRAGTRATEVWLGGWCDGALGNRRIPLEAQRKDRRSLVHMVQDRRALVYK